MFWHSVYYCVFRSSHLDFWCSIQRPVHFWHVVGISCTTHWWTSKCCVHPISDKFKRNVKSGINTCKFTRESTHTSNVRNIQNCKTGSVRLVNLRLNAEFKSSLISKDSSCFYEQKTKATTVFHQGHIGKKLLTKVKITGRFGGLNFDFTCLVVCTVTLL